MLGAVANSFVLFAILLQLAITQLDAFLHQQQRWILERKMSPKFGGKEQMSSQSAEKKEDFHTKDSLIRVLERQVYASWDSHVAVFMPVSLHKVSSFGISCPQTCFISYVTS